MEKNNTEEKHTDKPEHKILTTLLLTLPKVDLQKIYSQWSEPQEIKAGTFQKSVGEKDEERNT